MRTTRLRAIAPCRFAPRRFAPRHLAGAACCLLFLAAACSPGEETRHEDERAPATDARAANGAANETVDAAPHEAAELLRLASMARGYPTMLDPAGRLLARGEFAQWVEGGALHMRIVYDFEDGRRIEEIAVFGLGPGIVQTGWSWEETRREETLRRFEVDLERGTARGEKRAEPEEGEEGTADEEPEVERWSEELDIEPGRSFAGFGFTLALKAFRERLVAGEAIELQAIAITPEPRVVEVEITYQGQERMRMGGRSMTGHRFVVVPQVPAIAELFVEAPDTHIWLTEPPAEFLRSEGPLLEPDDPAVRIDLLPGEESGPAEPL